MYGDYMRGCAAAFRSTTHPHYRQDMLEAGVSAPLPRAAVHHCWGVTRVPARTAYIEGGGCGRGGKGCAGRGGRYVCMYAHPHVVDCATTLSVRRAFFAGEQARGSWERRDMESRCQGVEGKYVRVVA